MLLTTVMDFINQLYSTHFTKTWNTYLLFVLFSWFLHGFPQSTCQLFSCISRSLGPNYRTILTHILIIFIILLSKPPNRRTWPRAPHLPNVKHSLIPHSKNFIPKKDREHYGISFQTQREHVPGQGYKVKKPKRPQPELVYAYRHETFSSLPCN